jgi:hypothetical protein
MLGVFCQLLQLSKSFGPGYLPERSAPGETFENLRTEIKNPASSAGPIRLQTSTSGFARCSTEYYPVFVTGLTPSPERARLNRDRPLTLSTSRTAWEYNSFSRSVKRPLKFAEFRSVGISDLVEIRCRRDFSSIPKFKETHGKNETAECDCARPSRFIDKRLLALIRFRGPSFYFASAEGSAGAGSAGSPAFALDVPTAGTSRLDSAATAGTCCIDLDCSRLR